jgi:hypothetical protein
MGMKANFKGTGMKGICGVAALLCVLAGIPARAQYAAPPPMPAYETLSAQQMDQLLGPIALYPDPLIAQILPAATLPTQIVLADRYVTGGGDPSQIEQQPWDASVQAVAHYPNVLKWMDDNLSWTTALGQAFINQQQDVMDSIQRLRATAQSLGNLQSTPQQQVEEDDGTIDIVPADPDMIYVPDYSPNTVYFQNGYGAPFITFGIGFPIGIWLNHDFDWHHHNVIIWDRDHPRPGGWWHERPNRRDVFLGRQTTVWHPDDHRGPGTVYRGDRGWGDRSPGRPVAPVIPHPVAPHEPPPHDVVNHGPPPHEVVTHPISQPEPPHGVIPHNIPPVVERPAPVQVQHVEPVNRPAPNNAFIGIQSSHDARTFSDRGQQSMQTVTHSAPVTRSAPSYGGGGGGGNGGGNHSQGSQQRH